MSEPNSKDETAPVVAPAKSPSTSPSAGPTEVSVSGVIIAKMRDSIRPEGDTTHGGTDKERRALLAAGEAIISEKGFARTSVDDVATRANLTPQIFYAHFQGTGALLRALSVQFVEQMKTVTDQATGAGIWKGAPARDVIEVAVRSILDVVIDRRGLVRAFLSHGATDEALMMDLRSIGTNMSQRLVAVLAECTNVPTRPSRAVAFSLLTAVALAHHWILVGDEWSGVSFSKEQLQEETAQAICAYLGLKPTIAFRENETFDTAPTGQIEALQMDLLKTDEQPLLPHLDLDQRGQSALVRAIGRDSEK